MSVRNLSYLTSPKSVAVFGASDNANSVGGLILKNIRMGGFAGPVFVVNPKYASVGGARSYASAEELPDTPDLAIVAVPASQVKQVIAALAARGTKAVVVITAGFSGNDAASKEWQRGLVETAQPQLMRIVGPNCFGVLAPAVGLNAYFGRSPVRAGHLALIAQSGAMISAMLDWAASKSIGFSHVVSLGDMIDVDFGDMLDVLANDAKTHAILLYVETITHARKFMSAARAAARLKPVIVVKSGRTAEGARAASSHTGAVAGDDAVYDAAFARAGILRVPNLQALFDTAATLSTDAKVGGGRLAIITNGGGAGVMAADDLSAAGGVLAQLASDTIAKLNKVLPPMWSKANPIDLIGDAAGERYGAALDIISEDPGVDAILAMHCPTGVVDPSAVAAAVTDAAARTRKPVFACWLGEASVGDARLHLTTHSVATTETPEAAVTGFMNMVRHNRLQQLLLEAPAAGSEVAASEVRTTHDLIARAVAAGDSWLAADVVRRVLNCYGIVTNRILSAPTPELAAEAAKQLGGKVAIKINSPDIVHKSDAGGVVLGVSQSAVADAARNMMTRIAIDLPKARISGITVEEMIERPGAHELFLGMTVDPTFGPVVAFGQGGTAVEVSRDIALGLPPLNTALATAMIQETRIARVLKGFRHRAPADLHAVANALVRLSQMVIDHPELADIDINPLIADDRGVIAVDARIRLHPQGKLNRLAICPYPSDLAHAFELSHRWRVYIRPIRPQDEEALGAMVTTLDSTASRFRFFVPLHELDHAMAARLTQIDYDREMVLAAFSDAGSGSEMLGVAHLHADPDNAAAEFAILVRGNWQNRGLGTALMRELLSIARARGIGKVWGDVLRDNDRMLTLGRELGFRPCHGEDPALVRLELSLAKDSVSAA